MSRNSAWIQVAAASAQSPAAQPLDASQLDAGAPSPAVRAQLLATEHWSLLATRSTTQSEVLSRITTFLMLISASVISLGLIGQLTRFDQRFITFALVLLGMDLVTGMLTQLRVRNASIEDLAHVIGMNRLRAGYVELDPAIERYLVTSAHDDTVGVWQTYNHLAGPNHSQRYASTGAFITFLNSGLAGVIAALIAAANLTGLIGFAGMLSMFYFLTLYMQRVLGYSPVVAGAAYLQLTFGVGIAAGIGAKLVTKVGSRAVICVGALVAATGLFLLGHVPVGGGYPAHILPGLLLVAFGVGPVFVGVTTAANAGVGPSRAGLAAAILNSSQQLGAALGLAIFSAVGTAQVHHLLARGIPVPDATTSGIGHALVTGAAFAAAAGLIALATTNTHEDPNETHGAEPQADSPRAAAAPEPITKEI